MIDWGMEACTLHIRLPSTSDTRFNSTVTLYGGSNAIEIYRLESDSVINLDSLSFRTSPRKSERLGTVNAVYNMDWNYDFPCTMDSLHAFALVPSNDKTSVEWWQDKQAELPGKWSFLFSCLKLRIGLTIMNGFQLCILFNIQQDEQYICWLSNRNNIFH
jgi:Ubiquitin 3 binding protein But2 C-terminal domain